MICQYIADAGSKDNNCNNEGPLLTDNEASFHTDDNNHFDDSATALTVARQSLISKLLRLGIELQDETRLHTDMVVAISEYEYQVDSYVINA
ncbi:MAG: hypothetical protein M3275_15470 [Thermoproteota archaeon]|jgi:hypothetical protein|nr:hypothetical protein [Thermoproteota archaeon]